METKWSKVIIHASAFFAPFLVPIIFFLISSEEEVKNVSVQALLFQIAMGVLIVIASILSIVLIGLPFLLIFIAIGIHRTNYRNRKGYFRGTVALSDCRSLGIIDKDASICKKHKLAFFL
ncbi:hypothetical protein LSPH24S_01767 [Lysinibacillus sphaericus]